MPFMQIGMSFQTFRCLIVINNINEYERYYKTERSEEIGENFIP